VWYTRPLTRRLARLLPLRYEIIMVKFVSSIANILYCCPDLQRIRLEVDDEGVPSTTLREISTLRHLKHDNVVE
jgi:hypothetical protein